MQLGDLHNSCPILSVLCGTCSVAFGKVLLKPLLDFECDGIHRLLTDKYTYTWIHTRMCMCKRIVLYMLYSCNYKCGEYVSGLERCIALACM